MEEKDDDDKAMFKAGQRCLLRFIKLLLLWDPQIAAAIIDIFHHFKSIIFFPFSYKQIIAQHSIKILPRFGWFCVPCHWKYWFINSFSGDLANKSEILRYKKIGKCMLLEKMHLSSWYWCSWNVNTRVMSTTLRMKASTNSTLMTTMTTDGGVYLLVYLAAAQTSHNALYTQHHTLSKGWKEQRTHGIQNHWIITHQDRAQVTPLKRMNVCKSFKWGGHLYNNKQQNDKQ